MSFRSMTGYGRAERAGFEVTLSTVNRKQFDCVVHLSRPLAALEARMVARLKKRLGRGRVSGVIQRSKDAREAEGGLDIDTARAVKAVKDLRAVASELVDCSTDISIRDLITLPGVVKESAGEIDPDALWPDLLEALDDALEQVVVMRDREGAALEADLLERLKALEAFTIRIREGSGTLVERKRQDLHQRLETAGLPVDMDDERLLKELAIFAERSDITEEITRIDSHLAQFLETQAESAEQPVGRKLDFICQELGREINTIGSKSTDGEISRTVIAFKTELERIREQVQNVE